MPAPKGNRNAAKANPKTASFGVRLSAEAGVILDNMAASKKLPRSQIVENLILSEYKRNKKET